MQAFLGKFFLNSGSLFAAVSPGSGIVLVLQKPWGVIWDTMEQLLVTGKTEKPIAMKGWDGVPTRSDGHLSPGWLPVKSLEDVTSILSRMSPLSLRTHGCCLPNSLEAQLPTWSWKDFSMHKRSMSDCLPWGQTRRWNQRVSFFRPAV